MISVIICSASRERAATVRQNIAATIGTAYELIVMENALELGGICAAYNQAAARAAFDILCFVHDDVLFLTQDWGLKIAAHFRERPGLALTGLAGSRYKSRTVSGWWTGLPDADCCNIFQRLPDGSEKQIILRPAGFAGDSIPVRTLDGVCLCMRKEAWRQFPFNSEALPGFHFYDLDISLRVSAAHEVAVIFDVDLVHFSNGNFGNEWVEKAIRYHRQVNRIPLPCSVDGHTDRKAEQRVNRSWLLRLRGEKISWRNKFRWCLYGGAWRYMANWPHIVAFSFSIFLKRGQRT